VSLTSYDLFTYEHLRSLSKSNWSTAKNIQYKYPVCKQDNCSTALVCLCYLNKEGVAVSCVRAPQLFTYLCVMGLKDFDATLLLWPVLL